MPPKVSGVRAVLYARVSTELQEHPDLQIDELRRVAAARGWVIVGELIERASGADRNRPKLAKAVAMIRQARARVLAAVSLDRISRSVRHTVELIDELKVYNGELVCVRDGELDTTTAAGRAFVGVRSVFAQLERDLASERAREAKASLKARGLPTGGQPLLATPAATERAIQLRLNGARWREVIATLEVEGFGAIGESTMRRAATAKVREIRAVRAARLTPAERAT
jgi:DNA invertase Pin-like site-specific DNA recombinase